MADAKDIEDDEPKKPSLIGAIVLPLLLLLLSGGMGFAFAKFHVVPMISTEEHAMPMGMVDKNEMADAGTEDGDEDEDDDDEQAMGQTIVPLEPIVANLSDPSDVWVRAEFSVVFSEAPESGVPEQIQSDFVAYLKTVKLQNLEGSIGFHHLMEDLEDRANLLSEEKANKVLVRAFIVE